jgi:hypothetical protein
LTAAWGRVTHSLIAPILTLAASVENFEDFQKSMAKLIESINTAQLSKTLAQGRH